MGKPHTLFGRIYAYFVMDSGLSALPVAKTIERIMTNTAAVSTKGEVLRVVCSKRHVSSNYNNALLRDYRPGL
jgi:hypothetical protein